MCPEMLQPKSEGGQGFKVSNRWVYTFMHSQGFVFRKVTSVAQKVPVDVAMHIQDMNYRISVDGENLSWDCCQPVQEPFG